MYCIHTIDLTFVVNTPVERLKCRCVFSITAYACRIFYLILVLFVRRNGHRDLDHLNWDGGCDACDLLDNYRCCNKWAIT